MENKNLNLLFPKLECVLIPTIEKKELKEKVQCLLNEKLVEVNRLCFVRWMMSQLLPMLCLFGFSSCLCFQICYSFLLFMFCYFFILFYCFLHFYFSLLFIFFIFCLSLFIFKIRTSRNFLLWKICVKNFKFVGNPTIWYCSRALIILCAAIFLFLSQTTNFAIIGS